jgi:type IV pilus assembly protein PilQ
MEGEGRARILSSPSLMTLDNESATIASGEKIPIISTVVTGGAARSVDQLTATTRLQVVPRVLAEDRQIVLNLAVKRETLQELVPGQGLLAPRVSTRSTITQVRIPDGGTVVIGGLREDQTRSRNEGLPWLKKIPVLGWLFKNDLIEGSRAELIVFLTAKVIDNPGQAAVTPDLAPVAPGSPLPPGPTGQGPVPAPAKPPVAAVAGPPASAPRPTYPVRDVGGR